MAINIVGGSSPPELADTLTAEFADDVRASLGQHPRQLPSRYFYDALGSALFDAICRLPWYKVTRAETSLLARHRAQILAALDPLADVVELGAGSGEKLAVLLAALRPDAGTLSVHLVDVSQAALETAAQTIGRLGNLEVITHEARFLAWLEAATPRAGASSPRRGRRLMMFLGSNIGNFDPPGADDLLRRIRGTLRPGDGLLLGADLIKPEAELLLAYDDPLGVTAAFNKNLLMRLERELGADVDLDGFRHHVLWNGEAERIEMHLVSTRTQRIRIPAAGVDLVLTEGETIWTESSHKYRADDVARTLERCGFRRRAQWIDDDGGFALTLVEVAAE
jgi:L-histidine Nalpha-methyltransferase